MTYDFHHTQESKDKFITYNGETKNLTQWAEMLGIKQSTMMQRYFTYKWDIEKCLNFKK